MEKTRYVATWITRAIEIDELLPLVQIQKIERYKSTCCDHAMHFISIDLVENLFSMAQSQISHNNGGHLTLFLHSMNKK